MSLHQRFFLLGEELVGAGPLGVLGGRTKFLVQGELPDLDDGTVSGVGEVMTVLIQFADNG